MAKENNKVSKKSILNRIMGIYLLVFAMLLCITGKALWVKIADGTKCSQEMRTDFSRENVPLEAIRGNILASDGRKLACSVPNYRIIMDPSSNGLPDDVFNKNIGALSQKLSKFFGDKTPYEYQRMIEKARADGKNHYLIINNRRITYNEMKEVSQFPIFCLGRNKGGFMPEESDNRKKPFGLLASRTVGRLYLDKTKGGMVGIENSFDDVLRGVDGLSDRIRVMGKWTNKEITAPQNGKDIITTIDIDIQDVAEYSMMRQLKNHNADHGIAILMEVRTGAIKAIVNLRYDQKTGTFSEDNNYAVTERAEPGSTFKLATLIACMEDGIVNDVDKDSVYTNNGVYEFAKDAVLHDSKPHEWLTIRKAFEASSNIAFARLVAEGYKKDPQQFIDRLHDLGLCDSLQFDLKGTRNTMFKNYDDPTWSGTTLPWMAIGYEMQITPLQLLTFYNTVANNGVMMRPMLIEGYGENGRITDHIRPKVLRNSIASRKTIRTVHELLKGVVEDGTAKNIKGTPYGIAGKTGTAQLVKEGGGYEKRYLASFAGYFPADKPLYSCIVMVYGPSNNVYYGNVVAGNVVKAIADRVYAAEYRNGNVRETPEIALAEQFPFSKGGRLADINRVFNELKIPHNLDVNSTWISTTAEADKVKLTARHLLDNSVPDVKGMGASDAVSLLEAIGLKVKIIGVGRVSSQSIAAGSTYTKGSTITIELENG
ncbi:MAG: transpeptidase family protein [Bacteroidales bacterium]|nr:transpeptidase family protein [Bacteroidales bacterium]